VTVADQGGATVVFLKPHWPDRGKELVCLCLKFICTKFYTIFKRTAITVSTNT